MVVEDEYLIALNIEMALIDRGSSAMTSRINRNASAV